MNSPALLLLQLHHLHGRLQLLVRLRQRRVKRQHRLVQGVVSHDDLLLPELHEGDQVDLQQLKPSQHFTKPAPRYSEASLVKELEKKGIGRPSTYAAIISTIQERGYVSVQNRRFYAEKMGDIVTDRLQESFVDLMDYDFTAKMEERLDSVAPKNLPRSSLGDL